MKTIKQNLISLIVGPPHFKRYGKSRIKLTYALKSFFLITALAFLTKLALQVNKYKDQDSNLVANSSPFDSHFTLFFMHLFNTFLKKNTADGEPLQFGQYYSNWSPFKPYNFKPTDMDLRHTTHIYYSFVGIDKKTCKVYLMDKFSDTEYVNPAISSADHSSGLIMEFNYLRNGLFDNDKILNFPKRVEYKNDLANLKELNINANNFKLIMSIGGWSQSESFHKLAKSSECLDNFIDSCIDVLMANGFDGIDIDWEYPKNKKEYETYKNIFKRLRERFDELEESIFGDDYNKKNKWFHLSTAIPCDDDVLKHLHLDDIEPYVDGFNLMAYDLSGEWSEKTAYQSNLYEYGSNDDSSNADIDSVVTYLLEDLEIKASKIILGIPLYGRSFTNVKAKNSKEAIGAEFKGVDNWFDKNSPGVWPTKEIYKLQGYDFHHDKEAVTSYVYNSKKRHLIVFDDYLTIKAKGEYIHEKGLGGGFFWEANGDILRSRHSILSLALSECHELHFDKSDLKSIWTTSNMKDYYNKQVTFFKDSTLQKQSKKIADMLNQ